MHKKRLFFYIIIILSTRLSAQQDTALNKINNQIFSHSQGLAEKEKLKIKVEAESQPNVSVSYPEIHYEYKIDGLDKTTPIELVYNERVKEYIENYTVRRKKDFDKIVSLSTYYFPIFEEYLDKYNLPLELKYLAVVESGLNPFARSESGAVGLWQFKLNSGKMFDLRIDSFIDERQDVHKSTEAACKYFTYLYSIFNDWQLVISAFNGGPGEIRNAIYRSGGKTTLGDLVELFPQQTQYYFPAFVAAMYVMNYYEDHGITASSPAFTYYEIDTVTLKQSADLKVVAESLEISLEDLKLLNPIYKTNFIPESNTPNILCLPIKKIPDFLKNEMSIYSKKIEQDDYFELLNKNSSLENKIKIIHVVEKGEFFHLLAIKYNCSIENIKQWNNLDSNNLYPGQKLTIWIDKENTN